MYLKFLINNSKKTIPKNLHFVIYILNKSQKDFAY